MKRAAAIALTGLVAAGCLGGSKQEQAIPWIPNKPAVFEPKALARPCRRADLQIGHFFQGAGSGAGGGLIGGIRITHRGSGRCSLRGTPYIQFKGGSVQRLTRKTVRIRNGTFDRDGGLPPAALRSLERGDEAISRILWRNRCGRRPAAIAVELPNRGGNVTLGLGRVPHCDEPGRPPALSIWPFEALKPQPVALPLLPSFTETKQSTVKAGQEFHYRVALKNVSKRPFRFGRCPVYTQEVTSFHYAEFDNRVLNCRPVARLAPGEKATFEMVIDIPRNADAGWGALDWSFPSTVGDLLEKNLDVRR